MPLIQRTDAETLVPVEYSREILKNVPQASVIMSYARRAPDMSSKQRRVPVLNTLPTAYFVNGDTGQKQTTNMAWGSKYFDAEELAVIVPIPEAVLDDAEYDIWAEVRPNVEEALGVAFDKAVLYGTNAPAIWPDEILTAATAAGNDVTLGVTNIYDALLGETGVISKLEADGYMATGHIGAMSLRGKLRGLKDTTGQPIFKSSIQDATRYDLDGGAIVFPKNGAVNPAASLLFSGDWSQVMYAMRQDITYKLLTEATIYDVDGVTPLYRLAQQDMVALRVVMRIAWQIANPINLINSTGTRYPIAVLKP